MQEIRLTIPSFGYRIETRKRTVDRDSVPEVLTAAKQQKISYAVRNDNDVTIIKHVVVCSCCGQEVPAYGEFVERRDQNSKIQTKYEIEKWSTRQMSLFGEPPKIMHFNDPISEIAHFICPHCKGGLTPSKREIHVTIRTNKNIIKIMRALDLENYFSIKWMDQLEISEFDLYETITFNLRNGHTRHLDLCDLKRCHFERGKIGLSVGVMAQNPIYFYHFIIKILKTDDKNTPFLKRSTYNSVNNGSFYI